MRDFVYTAPSFVREDSINSIMSIRITAGGLCFSIQNGGEILFLLSRSEKLNSEREQLEFLLGVLSENKFDELKFNSIKVYVASQYKLLLPNSEVVAGKSEVWMRTLCDKPYADAQISRASIDELNATLLFHKVNGFEEYLSGLSDNVQYSNLAQPFIKNSLASIPVKSSESWVFVEYSAGVIDIAVAKGRKLQFFNSYQATTSEEALFYLLQVIKMHNLNKKVNLVFSGEVDNRDDMIYATLKRYEPSITMAANVNLKGICENENMEIMPLFVHILG